MSKSEQKVDQYTGLTQLESEVMKHIINAYNAFLKLEWEHPSELSDFVNGIHLMQDVLANRVVRRAFPVGWFKASRRGPMTELEDKK